MIAASKAVIVVSPINRNNMPVRLKTFPDRTTCMENLYHMERHGQTVRIPYALHPLILTPLWLL